MRKTLTIATKEVFRNGVTNGKAWELSNVTDTDGTKYSTFATLEAGQTYDCEVIDEKSTKINPHTNKPYVNKKISKIYKADFGAEEKEEKGQILEALEFIKDQNKEILEKLEGLEGV